MYNPYPFYKAGPASRRYWMPLMLGNLDVSLRTELNWTQLKFFAQQSCYYIYLYTTSILSSMHTFYNNWIAAPIKYMYGSRGPPQSDMLLKRVRSSYNQNGLPRVILTYWMTNTLFNRISFLGGICLQLHVFLGPSSECYPACYWWLSVLTCTYQLLFG